MTTAALLSSRSRVPGFVTAAARLSSGGGRVLVLTRGSGPGVTVFLTAVRFAAGIGRVGAAVTVRGPGITRAAASRGFVPGVVRAGTAVVSSRLGTIWTVVTAGFAPGSVRTGSGIRLITGSISPFLGSATRFLPGVWPLVRPVRRTRRLGATAPEPVANTWDTPPETGNTRRDR